MGRVLASMVVLIASCSSAGGGSYGTTHGAPESVVDSKMPSDGKFLSGEAVTLLPEVKPVPKESVHHVRLDVTHKVIEVADGVKYRAWTFGDDVPGPTIHVKQGDKVIFTLTNRSHETANFAPPMPHSIDFHAAMVSPQDKYRTILPQQTLTFEWTANYPGVFMYHCATPRVLQHLVTGMYGMTIVEPKGGYPTKVDHEYALVQSEFYATKQPIIDDVHETDFTAAELKQPSHVAFNGKALRHVLQPLKAKPGERIRLYVLNVGPSDTSSFHVIGTIFDRVWIDGNPANEFRGLQTWLLGASSGVIVEFVIPEKGKYVFVDHEFADFDKGALGVIDATE